MRRAARSSCTAQVPAPVAAPARDDAGDDAGEGEERPVHVLVGLERYALAEESLADGLARVMNSVPKDDGSGADWERLVPPGVARVLRDLDRVAV